MKAKILSSRFLFIFSMLLVVSIVRFFPHLANLTPLAAIALFAGVQIRNGKMAFLTPMVIWLLSDVGLEIMYHLGLRAYPGFYPYMISVYISFALIVLIGRLIRNKINPLTVISGALGGSLVFFIVSNFGVWLLEAEMMYTNDWNGLVNCFVAAIPFYKNAVLGDLLYSTVLFGGFYFLERKIPTLAPIREEIK